MTCIRLDATVTPAHWARKEQSRISKGHHPLLAYCDNTREALAGMLRCGSAGSNTVADHLKVLDAAITVVPAKHRRRLMVTCDGAGASHGLIARLDQLASRPGHQLTYSVGWDLGERERTARAHRDPPDPRACLAERHRRGRQCGNAAPMTRAATSAASMRGAGSRKPMSPS